MMSSKKTLFTLSLIFISGCASVGSAPEASLGEMPSSGPVGRTMQEHSKAFIGCGADSVSVQTGTVQNLQLRFALDKDGRVIKSEIEKMSAPDPDLRACVLGKL